jgi:putative PEP-CTERM system histidine kinase
MEQGTAFPAAFVYSLGLAGFLAFSLLLVLRWRRGRYAAVLLVAGIASALWEAASLAFCLWPSDGSWLCYQLSDALRVSVWLGFLASLFIRTRRADPRIGPQIKTVWMLTLGMIVFLSCWSLLFPITPPQTLTSADPGDSPGLGLWLVLSVLGLVLAEQLFRNTPDAGRWAIKPLCLGLGGVFSYDLFLYSDGLLFRHLDFGIWSARGLAHALTIPLILVSAARNKQWTIDIAVSRRLVFSSTSILLSGVYLLAIAGAGYYVRYFGSQWGSTVQGAFLFAALLLLAAVFSSGTMRAKLRVLVNKHFFSYRYDYREEWLRVTHLLSSPDPELGLNERCIKGLADLVESPAGAVWLKREDQLVQSGRWNMPDMPEIEPASGELATFLARTGWVVKISELRENPERYGTLTVPSWVEKLAAPWVIVPLMSGDQLIGFVVLATPRTPIDLNWEVLDLLKMAGRQAASFLSQILTNEALMEAKKFDAFNRMSAFVVHDLKNLATQLSLMLKNAQRHWDKPAFQKDMLVTVEHVVARMNNLLLQLRSGATPVSKPATVDLAPVARRIKEAKSAQGREISLDIGPDVHAVGHEDRLERVIGHLVQNALDATAADGLVALRVYRDGAFTIAEVWDNGLGMSPEFVRHELFKPFRTTKAAGMGIGVYESSQYVTELGGRLSVDSKPGAGTCVKVFVPRTLNGQALRDRREVA